MLQRHFNVKRIVVLLGSFAVACGTEPVGMTTVSPVQEGIFGSGGHPDLCDDVCSITDNCSKSCVDGLGRSTTCGSFGLCAPDCSATCDSTVACTTPCTCTGGACGSLSYASCSSYGVCNHNNYVYQVNLKRVRRCTSSGIFCNSTQTDPEFHWWDYFGVSNDKQKRTYLANMSEPYKNSVRHLAFFAAGQNFSSSGDDNLVTGQQEGYRSLFSSTDGEEIVSIDSGSLAFKHLDQDRRTTWNTYVGLAFDANFDQHFSPLNKVEIELAYYNWLRSKFYDHNLESVFLAGHSRGGCLVARLARQFTADFPDVPVVVALFDPVCTKNQSEMGVGSPKISHPTYPLREAWSTDLRAQYPYRTNLRVLNMVTGDEAVSIAWDAMGFSHYTAANVWPWYTHSWETDSHSGVDDWANISQARSFQRSACDALGCTY